MFLHQYVLLTYLDIEASMQMHHWIGGKARHAHEFGKQIMETYWESRYNNTLYLRPTAIQGQHQDTKAKEILLHVTAQGDEHNERGCGKPRVQSKIPPVTSPKGSKRFSSPRCAMEDSYRQPLILELGRCQEGKYDFERRVWEGEEFILERGPQKALCLQRSHAPTAYLSALQASGAAGMWRSVPASE
ncbi:hypothetical protein M430DRAFT_25382 [Amorphotheca resinae ATCC 22711]|uniref:Uncharacterized protein n=1 Tax=Amorphotheca resinae ATCC 22711 TaxID=857342 RepID=A0A2T3BB92_AMORE|nr:hypothetical protein M430DRAFT_25382 [Amorphotheca resinae ATCC 22711]PSS25603.1 hypothetical protein M430DRAFT_25382 [Amorphotheca resinae ATCC 22711]